MFKKLVPLFISLGLLFSVAYAVENYTISGDVTFQYDGDIYICLYTKEEFQDFTRKHEPSPPQCKVIKMNADLKRAEKVSFKFDSISKGTYCIITFQDVNKNGKLDYVNYEPDEPWGTYKELPSWSGNPLWDPIKFDLEKDITGINIQI